MQGFDHHKHLYPPKKIRKCGAWETDDESLWCSTIGRIPECPQDSNRHCLGMVIQPIRTQPKMLFCRPVVFLYPLQSIRSSGAAGEKGVKGRNSQLPKPTLFRLFSFFLSFFFFLHIVFPHDALFEKKKSFVFKKIFENHWFRPNFSIFYECIMRSFWQISFEIQIDWPDLPSSELP